MCVVYDPEVCLRDLAASRGITERSAYSTVTDLAEADYVVKQKTNGRTDAATAIRPRADLPLPEPSSQEHTVGTFWPFFLAPMRGRNARLLDPMNDLGLVGAGGRRIGCAP